MKTRITYILAPTSISSTSVQRKVRSQIEALRASGVNARGLFFVLGSQPHLPDFPNVQFVAVRPYKGKLFRSLINFYNVHKAVNVELKKSAFDGCIFYFRYPRNSPYLSRFAQHFKKRYFFEHVTSELDEISLYTKFHHSGGAISRLLGWLEFYAIPVFTERLYGARVRQNALFGICNSEEIAAYQKRIAKGRYNTIVLGDSVDVEQFRSDSLPELIDEFRFVFLKGSSSLHDYNGIDRILKGIAQYDGSIKLKFLLFGDQLAEETKLVKQLNIGNTVTLGRRIDKAEQDEVFRSVHLGVSALAVHRKGIRSTTTIKSREYCARGIPFIYAYDDPDLSSDWPFALKLDPVDVPVDFHQVIEWWKQTTTEKEVSSMMRAFALEKLDYSVKMNRLRGFLASISES